MLLDIPTVVSCLTNIMWEAANSNWGKTDRPVVYVKCIHLFDELISFQALNEDISIVG